MAKPRLRRLFDPTRFFKGQQTVENDIVLTHSRIFIVPNQRGLGLFFLLSIQLLASINYNNNLGFILTFLVGGIATLGIVYGFRNLSGLVLRAGHPNPAFAGDPARIALTIENPTQNPRIALQIGLRQGTPQELNLAEGESLALAIDFASQQRGWREMPMISVSSTFPLGLYHAWSPVKFKQRVLVYPRPSPDNIPFPVVSGLDGGHRQVAEDDFHGFQSYQPGDSLRRIHWKGVAKGQGVHVKEYRGEDSSQLYLDWSQTPGFDAEARLSRLCRWVLEAEKIGASYGLRLPGTDIKPSSGQAHMRVCLEKLALFGLDGK